MEVKDMQQRRGGNTSEGEAKAMPSLTGVWKPEKVASSGRKHGFPFVTSDWTFPIHLHFGVAVAATTQRHTSYMCPPHSIQQEITNSNLYLLEMAANSPINWIKNTRSWLIIDWTDVKRLLLESAFVKTL